MLSVIEIVALVLAVLAIALPLLQEAWDDGTRDYESPHGAQPSPDRRPLGLLVAALLVAVASATALVDAKVADAPARAASPTPASAGVVAPATPPTSDYFARELKNFRGGGELHESRLRHPLKLVRYFDRLRARDLGAGDPGATW
jgi:hypothetical protein